MSYTNPILRTGTASGQSIYETKTVPLHHPGTTAVLPDGREYVYVANRGSAIATGKLCKFNEVSTNTDLCVIPTQTTGSLAVGSTILNITLPGSTTYVENQLLGDFLNIDDDTGEGTLYKILGNPALTAGTALTVVIEPLRVAITTSTTVTVVTHYNDVQIADANQTQRIAGVTQVAIGAGSTTPVFFWLQNKGLVSVLMNGTPAVGTPLVPSGTTAGAVDASAEAGSGLYDLVVGTMVSLAGVSTEHHVAWINV
jgi:hypothetical protein